MEQLEYSSSLLEDAVERFSLLPGIGKRTALRLALHLLKMEEETVKSFSEAVYKLRTEVKYCRHCHNLSDSDVCDICADRKRDQATICVVENVRDVISIEDTMQYKGVYHVLGGLISPMDGIAPADLTIEALVERIKENPSIEEVILALSATQEGDTTNFFIYRRLAETGIKITTLARGISVGDELQYADQVTLGRALQQRLVFQGLKV